MLDLKFMGFGTNCAECMGGESPELRCQLTLAFAGLVRGDKPERDGAQARLF